MTDYDRWEPTRHGGLRRTGVAQTRKSAARIMRRSAARNSPPVLVARWGEKLGLPECPYLTRWTYGLRPLGSIRVHHFHASDDERALHDHPWSFVTLVLAGGYVDLGEHGYDVLSPGSIRYRPAHHRHAVRVEPGGCWTVLVTGPVRRKWGFWPAGKFVRANKYFAKFGHHPCE